MSLSEDLTGRSLDKYELRERIGRGGMAEVYHASLDRLVAIKVLHPFLGEDPEFKERFEREARNIAKLRHNNIIQVFDFDHDEQRDLYFMIMEFIDGPTLRNLMIQHEVKGDRLPIAETIRIARALAGALAYAHEHDMVHRDIKPANVMIDADKRVVLTDFGIAKIATGQQITASGTMIGTPAYMAPEQGLGQAGDHRSDIYSLGVVMFQLAAGRPPYEADTPIGLVLKHVNDPLPVLKKINSAVPEGLERIIYKSMAKSPGERLQSAQELYNLLSNVDAAADMDVPAGESTQKLVIPESLTKPAAPITKEVGTAARAAVLKLGSVEIPSSALLAVAALAILATAIIAGVTFRRSLDAASSDGDIQQADAAAADNNVNNPVAGVIVTEGEEELGTPDFEATALLATLDSIRNANSTRVAIGTPNPDVTNVPAPAEIGCHYQNELVSYSPRRDNPLVENSTFILTAIIANSGNCAWGAGTTFEFLDGLQLGGLDSIVIDREIQPGGRITIRLELTIPPFTGDRTAQSNWQLTMVDGERIGPFVTFDFTIMQATPTPTPTPTLLPTPTP